MQAFIINTFIKPHAHDNIFFSFLIIKIYYKLNGTFIIQNCNVANLDSCIELYMVFRVFNFFGLKYISNKIISN